MKKVTFNLYMDKEEGKFNLALTAEDSKEQSCVTIRNYEHIDFETVCKVLNIRNKDVTLPDDGFSSQVKRFNAHVHIYFDLDTVPIVVQAIYTGKVETVYSSSFEKLTKDQQEKLKKVIENS